MHDSDRILIVNLACANTSQEVQFTDAGHVRTSVRLHHTSYGHTFVPLILVPTEVSRRNKNIPKTESGTELNLYIHPWTCSSIPSSIFHLSRNRPLPSWCCNDFQDLKERESRSIFVLRWK